MIPAQNQLMKQFVKTSLISLVPLLVFFIIESQYGILAGLVAAVILSLFEILFERIYHQTWDKIALASFVLILLMGAISLLTQSNVFIKLKPAIFEGIFTLVLLGSLVFKKPILYYFYKSYLDKMTASARRAEIGTRDARPAEKKPEIFELNPQFGVYLNGLTLRIGLIFLLHTALTIYAAIYMSTAGWAFVKGIFYYLLMGGFFVFETFYIRRFKAKMQTPPDTPPPPKERTKERSIRERLKQNG